MYRTVFNSFRTDDLHSGSIYDSRQYQYVGEHLRLVTSVDTIMIERMTADGWIAYRQFSNIAINVKRAFGVMQNLLTSSST